MLDYAWDSSIDGNDTVYFDFNGKFYAVNFKAVWGEERGGWTDCDYAFIDTYEIEWQECERTAEIMGTVWALDQIFGHTVNTKGYKVLPPQIKAIYGDSITPQRCEEIYKRLTAMGYAINNVSLGVGSFSFMCLETIDNDGTVHYNPYTRDTFGIAIKATYGELEDGTPINIFKNPKALSWKKSQKGCVIVAEDGQSYTDEHTFEEAHSNIFNNLLRPVFVDGYMWVEQSLSEIRDRMYPEGF